MNEKTVDSFEKKHTIEITIDGDNGESSKVQVSPMGLKIVNEIGRDSWRTVGKLISYMVINPPRPIACWRMYGGDHYGKDVVDHEGQGLLFPQKLLMQSKQLALLEDNIYMMGISPEHASVLTCEKLSLTPNEQIKWAKESIKHSLTPGELRASIDEGKVTKRGDIERKDPISLATLAGIRMWFDRFCNTTLKERPLDQWTADDLKEALDDMKPIYLFCERAAALWKANRHVGRAE